ncbi:MAG: hypothetical protein ACXWLB_08540, partial [Reyranella sp.]
MDRPTPPTAAPLLDLMLRQRVLITAALAGLTAFCWLYLFVAAADMRAHGPQPRPLLPRLLLD